MSYSASFQLKGLPDFKVQKNEVTQVPIESDLLDKISLEPKMSDLFFKTQTLPPGSFSALLPAKTQCTSFKGSIFLYSTIFQKVLWSTLKVIYVSSK